MKIRKYSENDVPAMIRIWNEVVEEGVAFPQLELLDKESGRAFFAAQTYCGVADDNGTVVGLYILHPNNVGRCGHIANASYAVDSACRGKHIGEQLVSDCLVQARNNGFKLMQFNAVVENNTHARHLYERLGFVQVGMIPNGFLMKDGSYQNIFLYYHVFGLVLHVSDTSQFSLRSHRQFFFSIYLITLCISFGSCKAAGTENTPAVSVLKKSVPRRAA